MWSCMGLFPFLSNLVLAPYFLFYFDLSKFWTHQTIAFLIIFLGFASTFNMHPLRHLQMLCREVFLVKMSEQFNKKDIDPLLIIYNRNLFCCQRFLSSTVKGHCHSSSKRGKSLLAKYEINKKNSIMHTHKLIPELNFYLPHSNKTKSQNKKRKRRENKKKEGKIFFSILPHTKHTHSHTHTHSIKFSSFFF